VDVDALDGIPLFDGLTPDELQRIAERLQPVDVPTGWFLLNQGSYPEGFFVVLEGEVTVERDGTPIATIGPGNFFGEIALLEDDRRTATVTTATRVRAAVMESSDFFEMCAEIPAVADRITAAAMRRGER
jgi:CRP-like cAMP-binding protein